MGSQSRVGRPEVRAQRAMKVQRAGGHRGQRGQTPGEQRTTADRPGSERLEATAARSADPCCSPCPTPLWALRPGPMGRLSAVSLPSAAPPLPPAACLPVFPDRGRPVLAASRATTAVPQAPQDPPAPAKTFPINPQLRSSRGVTRSAARPAPTSVTSPRNSALPRPRSPPPSAPAAANHRASWRRL